MNKLTYLLVAATALCMVSCTPKQAGYVVSGTVEGAIDGDTIFLQQPSGRELVSLDTAVIANGTFTFEGVQDSVASRYLSYPKGNLRMDFFLENGKIKIALTKENDSATGTPNNDAYQEVRGKINELSVKGNAIYSALGDSTLTEEQKEAKRKELNELQDVILTVNKEGIEKNITNPVGVMLLKQNYYSLKTEDVAALLGKLSVADQKDGTIVKIKENVEKKMKTAVGQKYIDFEMLTPEGKPVKLSDYVGKGKLVLVDFWASWCGPCVREMPNLVDAYKKYKGKKFEIVGVSLDQSADSWKAAIKKLNMGWPQMSDLKHWNSEGANIYGVNSIPHTMLIDGEGTIISRGLHGEELLAKLAELMK